MIKENKKKKVEDTEYLSSFVANLYFSKLSSFFISMDSTSSISCTEPANFMPKLLYLLESRFRSMCLGAGLPKQAAPLCLRV